jgi:DNA-directed RNA polymerase specialized sigma24 family protein
MNSAEIAKEVAMHRSVQLQFQRLPPEAQRAALWRLALSGLTAEQVAERTGWSVEQVRRAMDGGPAQSTPPWQPVSAQASGWRFLR